MNKIKSTMRETLTIATLLFALMLFPTASVSASTPVKKLTVNKTYAGAKKVTGKVTLKKGKKKSGYKVKAQIGTKNKSGKYKYKKKKYTAKVSKKTGKFTIKKMPKLKAGQKVKVKLYNGKKLVKKKVIKVKTKITYISEQFLEQFEKDLPGNIERLNKAKKPGGDIVSWGGILVINHPADSKSPSYTIGKDGIYSIGNVGDYDVDANGSHVIFKALNGATIYGCVPDKNIPLTKEVRRYPDPVRMPTTEDYDFMITSGQEKEYQGTDFKSLSIYGMFYKLIIYKDGKLVGVQYLSAHLIAGYSDDLKSFTIK